MQTLTQHAAVRTAEVLFDSTTDPAIRMQAAQVLTLAAIATSLAFVVEQLDDIERDIIRLIPT